MKNEESELTPEETGWPQDETVEPESTEAPATPQQPPETEAEAQPLAVRPPGATTSPATQPRMRRGKVARLPKAVRDRLNIMLLDGLSFGQIIKELGDHAKGITEKNITSWVAGGYRDWLREQQKLEETRVKQEVAMDLACPDGGTRIHQATLQLAATTLSDLVRKFDYTEFQQLLRDDPAQLIPFLNALARISDAQIKCERQLLETAHNEPTAQPARAPGLRPETRKLLEKELSLM